MSQLASIVVPPFPCPVQKQDDGIFFARLDLGRPEEQKLDWLLGSAADGGLNGLLFIVLECRIGRSVSSLS